MIYLVEAYNVHSKVSKVLDTYSEASTYMNELSKEGYKVAVSPLELTKEQFGESCLIAVKDYYTKDNLDA